MTDVETERPLRVFSDDGVEYVVAYDADDARAVLAQHWGGTIDDVPELTEVAGSISIICNAEGHIDDDGVALTLSAAEWAKREGRGYLCSTEY